MLDAFLTDWTIRFVRDISRAVQLLFSPHPLSPEGRRGWFDRYRAPLLAAVNEPSPVDNPRKLRMVAATAR